MRTLTAIAVLADDPAGAVPAVTGLADDHSPAVRAAVACSMLAGGHDESSVRVIDELLADPDEACRSPASTPCVGLATRSRSSVFARSWPTRHSRCGSPPSRRSPWSGTRPAIVPDLIAALDDPVSDVRAAAARLLRGLRHRAAGRRRSVLPPIRRGPRRPH